MSIFYTKTLCTKETVAHNFVVGEEGTKPEREIPTTTEWNRFPGEEQWRTDELEMQF